MGQCVYVTNQTSSVGLPVKGKFRTRELPSELWMSPEAAGRVLARDHFLNTTIGVWFHESDLVDKRALRRRLAELVRYVTSPAFLQHHQKPLIGPRAGSVWAGGKFQAEKPNGRAAGKNTRTKNAGSTPCGVPMSAKAHRAMLGHLADGLESTGRPLPACLEKCLEVYLPPAHHRVTNSLRARAKRPSVKKQRTRGMLSVVVVQAAALRALGRSVRKPLEAEIANALARECASRLHRVAWGLEPRGAAARRIASVLAKA